MWLQIDTAYDLVMNAILCHIHHIRNGDIFGPKERSCEFIRDEGQLE